MPGMLNFGNNPTVQATKKALDAPVTNQRAALNPYDPNIDRLISQTPLINRSDVAQIDLMRPSFGAQRGAALADIDRQTASGLAGAQTQLAQSGGLSAADRMALASQFNRNKIMGRQGAMAKYAGMEEKAATEADKAQQIFNANMLNQNLYANQQARERALQRQIDEATLQRQLRYSDEAADRQIAALPSSSILPF